MQWCSGKTNALLVPLGISKKNTKLKKTRINNARYVHRWGEARERALQHYNTNNLLSNGVKYQSLLASHEQRAVRRIIKILRADTFTTSGTFLEFSFRGRRCSLLPLAYRFRSYLAPVGYLLIVCYRSGGRKTPDSPV